MGINLTLLGQVLTFAVFVWVMMKFGWPLIMNAMHERQKRISDGLAAAERGARELTQAKQQSDAVLREAREQAQEILANANRQASTVISEAQESARSEGTRIIESARTEVQQEVVRAKEALRQEVSALAIASAEKIVSREIDARAHEDLLEKLTEEI